MPSAPRERPRAWTRHIREELALIDRVLRADRAGRVRLSAQRRDRLVAASQALWWVLSRHFAAPSVLWLGETNPRRRTRRVRGA